MTGLDQWCSAQRDHLDPALWVELCMRAAQVDALISEESFAAARAALPDLYDLTDRHDLPAWRVLAQLMESALRLASDGHLNRALDLAVMALTAAEQLHPVHHHALRMGARLNAIRCWLKVDEVGYAPDVLAISRQLLQEDPASDWAYWFKASIAWALWALRRREEAAPLLTQMLADLPQVADRADLIEGRAYIAYRLGRLGESAALYEEAAGLFDQQGLRYSVARCQLNRALCLHEASRHVDAIALIANMMPRIQGLGSAHYSGLAHCFRGRAALALGDFSQAVENLEQAIDLYRGRGWLRDEAQLHIDRLEAMRGLPSSPGWGQAVQAAHDAVSRLRSIDLVARLEAACNGGRWPTGR